MSHRFSCSDVQVHGECSITLVSFFRHVYTAGGTLPTSKDRNDVARRLEEITRLAGRGGLSAYLADKRSLFLSKNINHPDKPNFETLMKDDPGVSIVLRSITSDDNTDLEEELSEDSTVGPLRHARKAATMQDVGQEWNMEDAHLGGVTPAEILI